MCVIVSDFLILIQESLLLRAVERGRSLKGKNLELSGNRMARILNAARSSILTKLNPVPMVLIRVPRYFYSHGPLSSFIRRCSDGLEFR
jgi:hypothetical protein